MASRYRLFLRLCQEWHLDPAKEGRDLGELIRHRVGEAFKQGEITTVDAASCDRTYDALQKLNKDFFRQHYPRSAALLGATGSDAESCGHIVSNEFMHHMQQDGVGILTRLKRCDDILAGIAIGIAVLAVLLCGFLFALEMESVSEKNKYCKVGMHLSENLQRYRNEGKSAFVLGYSGEVGRALLLELNRTKAFRRVILFGRRLIDLPNDIGTEFEQEVVDMGRLEKSADFFTGLDVGFCALGTTRRKSGEDGFVKVDHDYVLKAAEVAKSEGCEHFNLVSSQGADKNSLDFYPKTKGMVEESLKAVQFKRLSIFRPAFLLCNRNEVRGSETAFSFILKPLAYLFPTAITVPVEVVAQAMLNNAVTPTELTVEVYENKAIHILASNKTCTIKDEM